MYALFDELVARLAAFKGGVINSNVSDTKFAHWPAYRTLTVGERTVLIGGFVTDDMSKFAPACQPTAAPVPVACVELWERAKAELGRTPDLFLPMTHQYTKEDRETAEARTRARTRKPHPPPCRACASRAVAP